MRGRSKDNLNLFNDPSIVKLLDSSQTLSDSFEFSGSVERVNTDKSKEEYTLLISDKCLYFLKNKIEHLKLPITNVLGITKLLKHNSKDIIIHINTEYDWYLESKHTEEIINFIKLNYLHLTHKKLPIYGVKDKIEEYISSNKISNISSESCIIPNCMSNVKCRLYYCLRR